MLWFSGICAKCVGDAHECWWITYEWLLERLHAVSITNQWSASLASQPSRLARWVLDGPQIKLIGSCCLAGFFFLLTHSHDEHPHWWRRTPLVCGWLGFKLGCQGMELRKQPELSATLAVGLHHSGDKNTDARGCNASLSSRVKEKTRALNNTPEIMQSGLDSKTNIS